MPYDTPRERVETAWPPERIARLGATICSGLAILILLYVAFTGHG